MSIFSLFGCGTKTTSNLDGVKIEITTGREDSPKFLRKYTSKINGVEVEIEIKDYGRYLGLYKSGTLTQWNGRWVLFDPEAVADKIIDPVLAPLVQTYSDKVIAMDKQFRDDKPKEFVDERGITWRRAE